jgi:Flp pilus assembly protein TadD
LGGSGGTRSHRKYSRGRWARNLAFLIASVIALRPGQGVAGPEPALLGCITLHGRAALYACDEAATSTLEPAMRAAAYYNKGLELASAGRYKEAAHALRQAARLSPGIPEIHTSLGAVLGHLHHWHEAAWAHRQAVRADADDRDAHYNLGVALAHIGRWTEAISEFRTTARLDPADADARYNLGIAFNAVGNHKAAIAAYGEAVRLRPDYAAAWGNLGMTAFLLDRNGDAAAAFARAGAAQPDYFATREIQRLAWEQARQRLQRPPSSRIPPP